MFPQRCAVEESGLLRRNGVFNCLIVVLPCILISTKLFYQQMHLLLKDKMLQFIFKMSFLIWLLHVSISSDHHQGAYDGTLPMPLHNNNFNNFNDVF